MAVQTPTPHRDIERALVEVMEPIVPFVHCVNCDGPVAFSVSMAWSHKPSWTAERSNDWAEVQTCATHVAEELARVTKLTTSDGYPVMVRVVALEEVPS